MTAVALREVDDRQDALPPLAPTGLALWAEQARQASSVSVSLAKTPFVPQSLRERPANREPDEIARANAVTAANITAAILTGQELGLEPMAALRSIDVIQGTPALRAMTMRAVVLAHGHDLWVAESNATRCIVRGKRRGSDQVQESVWTLDRAKALGISGKDNWRKQPAAMLIARATSECARLVAADALLGMPYSTEELDDGGDYEAAPPIQTVAAPAKRTARRRTTGQDRSVARPPVAEQSREPDPEPEFDDEPQEAQAADTEPAAKTTDEPADGEPEPIREAQSKKMFALYNELGITDRDERLADAIGFIGRDIASSTELSKDEATRLIDDLERRVSGMTPEEADQLFGGAK